MQRLGLDLGTNSMGWALFEFNPGTGISRLLDSGVHIYSDGRDPESADPLGKARREARQPRRQRDRRIARRNKIMSELKKLGLMPQDKAEAKKLEVLDPYPLRKKALDAPLPPHELGRAIFHLAQRRGFLSNRLTGDAKEDGVVKQSIQALEARMLEGGQPSLGSFQADAIASGERARGAFWSAREMVMAEFDLIIERQCRLAPGLGAPERFAGLRAAIFDQRPLKAQKTGVCTIDGESPRAAWAWPAAQRFRILSDLVHLRITEPPEPKGRRLSEAEFHLLWKKLNSGTTLKFESIAKHLKLPADARFNLETSQRKEIEGNKTAKILAAKKHFGAAWHKLHDETQAAIVQILLDQTRADHGIARELARFGLPPENADAVMAARLPQGHCHLGLPVIDKILPIMRDQGLSYAEAAHEAGYHHSDLRSGEARDELPYYGEILSRWCMPLAQEHNPPPATPGSEIRYGRIANPTVHTGLNQLRKLINAIIGAYGKPDQIHVELARDLKLGAKRLAEIDQKNSRFRALNLEADQAMREAGHDPSAMGRESRRKNRQRYRLWHELDPNPARRCCPFTGRTIGIRQLFSSEIEIEHILPLSRTLDDSMANKTLAFTRANRDKGERAPFEAFGHSPQDYDWEGIADRGTRLPKEKAWRFAQDAMQRFDENAGFLDRQLNDTSYLSRLTRLYLQGLYGKEDRVVALPGRLTALLRHHWGLNELLARGNWKNRDDHRHHAIDAAIIAATDRALLQKFARLNEDSRRDMQVPQPYDGFRRELSARLESMIVSHKPEHGLEGKMHDETAYGPTAEKGPKGQPLRAVRRPLSWFDSAKKLDKIRDPYLREELKAHAEAEMAKGNKLPAALEGYRDPADKPVRHLRTTEIMNDNVVMPVQDASGREYKAYAAGANAYMDVLRLPNGKVIGYTVPSWKAQQHARSGGPQPVWKTEHPAAKKLLRLFKGDLVTILTDEGEQTLKIYQLWTTGVVLMAPHNEGGQLIKRHKSESDPFRWTMASAGTFAKIGMRKAGTGVLGRRPRGG